MTNQQANGTRKVTFELPAEAGASGGSVCGEFNDWTPGATPLRRRKDGSLAAAVTLNTGRSYRYRYLLDDDRWENDWAADAYVPNDFGSEDALVNV